LDSRTLLGPCGGGLWLLIGGRPKQLSSRKMCTWLFYVMR